MTARTTNASSVDDLVASDKDLVTRTTAQTRAQETRIAKRRKELDEAESVVTNAAQIKLDAINREREELGLPQAPKVPASAATSSPTPVSAPASDTPSDPGEERVKELGRKGHDRKQIKQIAGIYGITEQQVDFILDGIDADTPVTDQVITGAVVVKVEKHDEQITEIQDKLGLRKDKPAPEPSKAPEPAASAPTEERQLIDDLPDKGEKSKSKGESRIMGGINRLARSLAGSMPAPKGPGPKHKD